MVVNPCRTVAQDGGETAFDCIRELEGPLPAQPGLCDSHVSEVGTPNWCHPRGDRSHMDAWAVHRNAGAKGFEGGKGLSLFARACGGEAVDDRDRVAGKRGEPTWAKSLEQLGVAR